MLVWSLEVGREKSHCARHFTDRRNPEPQHTICYLVSGDGGGVMAIYLSVYVVVSDEGIKITVPYVHRTHHSQYSSLYGSPSHRRSQIVFDSCRQKAECHDGFKL